MSPVSVTRTLVACVLFAVSTLSGCSSGDTVGSVTGQIKLNGELYSDCKVAIYCADTSRSLASKVREGTFEIKDVPPGEYVVMVYPIHVEVPENAPDPPDTSPIPKKYRARETTEFSVSVVANEIGNVEIELAK